MIKFTDFHQSASSNVNCPHSNIMAIEIQALKKNQPFNLQKSEKKVDLCYKPTFFSSWRKVILQTTIFVWVLNQKKHLSLQNHFQNNFSRKLVADLKVECCLFLVGLYLERCSNSVTWIIFSLNGEKCTLHFDIS